MLDIIQLLPDSVANQIAAGEVVQRPASVVKELLENAIDAGATSISLIIKDAGKSLIQVVDNGKGMTYNDARACFDRHATSKLRSADDLFALRTMGFRGEAMASIAAVAQVELKTCQPGAELGTLIVIDGSEVRRHEATACSQGTSTAVRNLFFNVPVRRNFLKSNPVETRYIYDELVRVALAYPAVGFNYYKDDELVMKLTGGKLSQRIVELFGNGYKENLLPCQEEISTMAIQGYVGKPASAKRGRGEQFLFVNDRYVRNALLHNIILKAYDTLLPADTHPFYVLKLQMDPAEIDVNVHPTKTEVKFQNEHMVCSLVGVAVKHSLATFHASGSIDFDQDVNNGFGSVFFNNAGPIGGNSGSSSGGFPAGFPSSGGGGTSAPRTTVSSRLNHQWGANTSPQQAAAQFFLQSPPSNTSGADVPLPGMRQYITLPSSLNKFKQATTQLTELAQQHTLLPVLGQYLVKIYEQGLMLVNMRNAMERIYFDRLQRQYENPLPGAQTTLFQIPIQLSPADFQLVMELQGDLATLGFNVDAVEDNAVVVRSLPADFPMSPANGDDALLELIEELKQQSGTKQALPYKERMLRSLAKQQVKHLSLPTSREEQETLITQLIASSLPNYTPDGKPTMIVLNGDKLEAVLRLNTLG